MTRYLTGLIAAACLTLGMTSDAKAQVAVGVGNPLARGGFYANPGAVQVGYANPYYVVAPVVRHHGPARHQRGRYGYAPRAYVTPRFYGGHAPRHHHNRHYGYRW